MNRHKLIKISSYLYPFLATLPSERGVEREKAQVKPQSRDTNRNKRKLAPPPTGPSRTSISFTTNMIRITNSVRKEKKKKNRPIYRNDFSISSHGFLLNH
jgi:hypothetical protein